MKPTPKSLATKREMLKTLRMAYQHVLDLGFFTTPTEWPPVEVLPRSRQRLSDARARDLGRRLATYWDMKP